MRFLKTVVLAGLAFGMLFGAMLGVGAVGEDCGVGELSVPARSTGSQVRQVPGEPALVLLEARNLELAVPLC